MNHKPYIMKVEEIEILITSMIANGPEETYAKMRARAFIAMDKKDDIDEMFLDMSEVFLKRGRDELNASLEDNDDGAILLINIHYSLAFMLRRLSHEVYRKYLKKGKQRDTNRFIRLVSYNKEAPLLMI